VSPVVYPRALGRFVEHDERSRQFPASTLPLRTVTWAHHGPVLDQGNLGSCTGNAMSQCLNTDPFRAPLEAAGIPLLDESTAVAIYSWATHSDSYPGFFPPTDTGSSGLAVAKAATRLGYLTRYHHAFGLAHTLGALSAGPVLIGIPWLEGMFDPDPDGYLHPTGEVAGGHELVLVGLDTAKQDVTGINSWGENWGPIGGAFKLHWDDLAALLSADGDCTVPVL